MERRDDDDDRSQERDVRGDLIKSSQVRSCHRYVCVAFVFVNRLCIHVLCTIYSIASIHSMDTAVSMRDALRTGMNRPATRSVHFEHIDD